MGDKLDSTVEFPKIDPSSPYYLDSQDGPGAKISHIMLCRDNYHDWQHSMTMSLKARRKFGFIDGSIKKPTSEFDLDIWEAVHCTLVQWLRNTIDPSILDNVSYVADASVLWAQLKEQFDVVDGTKIHGLKTQLHNCKQIKGMDVTSYYGKLKSLWDVLIVHEPPFACKCGKCECDIGTATLKRLDNERLHQFFMGIDSSLYGGVRSQQFQLDPLPSLSRAYSVVVQQECLRSDPTTPDVSEVAAFAALNSSVYWRVLRDQERGERRQMFCSFCETRGHEVSNFFFKTKRFPDWWGERPRTMAEYRRWRKEGSRGIDVGASSSSSGRDKQPTAHVNAVISGATAHSLLANDRLSGPNAEVTNDTTSDSNPEAPDDTTSGPSVSDMISNEPNHDIPESSTTTSNTTGEAMGRGQRQKFPNSRLRGYVLKTAHSPSPPSSEPSTPKSPSAITAGVEPPTFKEAIPNKEWCDAMKSEIEALERNETWELTTLPPDKKALGCRWIYKIKYQSDGEIERLKARLVVFGNHQVEGLDFGETFAPVVKMVTVRTFLAVAAKNKWELHQMDVHNAFLHGDLDDEVYMKIPPGFSRGKDGQSTFQAVLFGASSYVDDLVIAGNDSSAVAQFKTYLGNCFHMKDLGPLKYFLGLEIARSTGGIFISQRKYTLDIISETGLLGCKPAATPIEQHHALASATGPIVEDVESYRCLVGRLVYLSVTRPDVSYAVHILSRFLQ
ncbi:uncharacterized protein LOC141601275 [Silene latifolia]|uniref:uncharacterized protein LOC141601275 n=1 Tax=Silene latifolia TaxID=37657 RepID=UPI003D78B042